jgi:hypothetical protein
MTLATVKMRTPMIATKRRLHRGTGVGVSSPDKSANRLPAMLVVANRRMTSNAQKVIRLCDIRFQNHTK